MSIDCNIQIYSVNNLFLVEKGHKVFIGVLLYLFLHEFLRK